jgi:hypothetical protein
MQQLDSIFTFVKEKILPHIDGDRIKIGTKICHKKVIYIMVIQCTRIVFGKIGLAVTGGRMVFALYNFAVSRFDLSQNRKYRC